MIGGSSIIWWILGMICWIYIIYEIFRGEAAMINKKSGNEAGQFAFQTLKWIVTIGWAIYPLGYLFGYLAGGVDANSLNIIYNLADFVNKIAFGLVIWSCAMQNTSVSRR